MIPKLHYLSEGKFPKKHLENIQKACNSGAELVQLQLDTVQEKKLLGLAKEAREITSHFQTRLILSSHYKIAREIKADGVYLRKSDICPTKARIYLYTWQTICGAATSLDDCEELLTKQVDYISLGPFKQDAISKGEAHALGFDGYAFVMKALTTETPILATGGIAIADVPGLLEAGISGISVSDAIAQDFNSIKSFHKLLNASSTEEQRHSFE